LIDRLINLLLLLLLLDAKHQDQFGTCGCCGEGTGIKSLP